MKIISVIIPVYYNQQSLPLLFTKLVAIEKRLAEKQVGLELIFVDDGSQDGSLIELKKIKEQRPATKVIKLLRNFGSPAASRIGLDFISGDCFMILAADLQDPPELILQLVDQWLMGNKYVICIRDSRDDPIISKFCSFLYYKMLRFFVVKSYPAQGFDVTLMDKEMLDYLRNAGKHINLNLYIYWLGYQPVVIKYRRLARQYGRSKWTTAKKLKFFIDSLFGFSCYPIRFISIVGLVVSLISFCYAVIVFTNAVLGHIPISGFATIVILISFLLGLVILMLGIIGEIIWRIFDQQNRTPQAIIEEIS